MGWFPLLVLIVFGMVSIAFMVQMPKEKPRHNIKRVIRGSGVEPVVEPVEVVDVVEPKDVAEPVEVVETNVFRDIPGSGFEQIYNLMKNKNTALCANTHILKGENSKEPDVHICLDNIRPPCVVYSFGIAYNWIFDDFMIDQGCHVFSFDPSMTLGKHKRHKNHLFEPIGIGPKSGTHAGKSTLYGGKTKYEVLSLQDMMKRYDHEHIDMIRMDVESAEWNVLQQWTHDNLWQHIDQLLLEIHMYENQQMHAETLMNIPMPLFHTAKNLWNNHRVFKDMTQVYEVGFKSPRSINIVTKPRPLTPHPSTNKVFKHTKLKYTVENSVLINKTLTSLLYRVVLILDLLDVKYTIAHGTLIGWARGKQFVPWDDDIDIRVDYNDWFKLQNIYETAKKSQKNWNITTIYVNGSTVDIPLVQADERLSMLNERNDIQFRVLGIGYTKFNKKEKLTDDIHLDLISSVSVAGGFWRDVRSAFRSEFIHSTMNGVNVTVTPHYDELLSGQYGNWRVPR